jgi:F0F1-type ATP synthase membrane subunit b/b'
MLKSARKEAASIVESAEKEGKAEAENYGKGSQDEIRMVVGKALTKKDEAVNRLVNIVLEGKA